jgi:uncharacterized membrane protein YheB (UPF0754 family)
MNCLPDHLLASKQIQELTRSDALVERITKLLVEAELLLKELKQKDDLRGAVSSLGELRRITEMIAKIGAELWEKQALNIHKDPAWAEIRTLILNTLKDYPEAKFAVISALEGVVK